jgi:hypothetical protein
MFRAGATTVTEPIKDKVEWDSHKAVDEIPETLVRSIDGNASIRRRFELVCRSAQVFVYLFLFI